MGVTQGEIIVYEAVNLAAKEIFVGLSSRVDIHRLIKTSPPSSVRHWGAGDTVEIREVELFKNRPEAEKFLAGYIASLSRHSEGWKVLCEAPL